MANPIYVDGTGGNDTTGDGTASLPYLTLNKALAVVAAAGTIYCRGPLRGTTTPTGAATRIYCTEAKTINGLTVAQWPGEAQAELRGDVQLVQSGWTASTNAWLKTIATGLAPSAVVYGTGHLVSDTLANVQAATGATGKYNYVSGTGVLAVYLGGANPNTSGVPVAYCAPDDTIGLKLTGTSNVVRDIDGYFYCGGGQSYAIRIDNCTNGSISGGNFANNGYHHVGFYNASGGPANTNNTVADSTFGCMRHDGTATVHYTDSAAGNITGAMVVNCVFTSGRFLGLDGLVRGGLSTNIQYSVYAHSDSGLKVTDLLASRCTFNEVAGEAPQGWVEGGDDNVPDPTTRTLHSTFAVRAERCTFNNLTQFRTREHFSARDCIINITRWDSGGEPSDHIGVVSLAYIGTGGIGLLDSCQIIFTHAGVLTTYAILFGVGQVGQDLYLLNCSAHDTSTDNDSGHGRIFMGWSGLNTAYIRARGTVFSSAIVGAGNALCFFDNSTDASHHDILDCAYWNVRTGAWSWHTSFDTQAEWLASIDTSAKVLTVAPFPNAPTTLDLNQNSGLWTQRRATSTVLPTGSITGTTYQSFHGAYQPLNGFGMTILPSAYRLLASRAR